MTEPEPINAARIRDAVRTLRELTECQCDPSYSSRALVDPVCSHEERQDVDALAAAIQQLTRERDEGTARIVNLSNELAAAERQASERGAAFAGLWSRFQRAICETETVRATLTQERDRAREDAERWASRCFDDPQPAVLEFNYRHPRRHVVEARRVQSGRLYYGTTEHHPEPQWLYEAYDLDRRDVRTFPLDLMTAPDG
jgi:hypothetical protein